MRETATYIIRNGYSKKVWYKNVTEEFIEKVIKGLNNSKPESKWYIDSKITNLHADYLDRYAIVETRSGKL